MLHIALRELTSAYQPWGGYAAHPTYKSLLELRAYCARVDCRI